MLPGSLIDALESPLVRTLGWTLLHFVWQGFAAALLLVIGLACLRRATPTIRYAAACAVLALMAAAPIATFALILQPTPRPSVNFSWNASPPSVSQSDATENSISPPANAPRAAARPTEPGSGPTQVHVVSPPLTRRIAESLQPWVPWVVLAWALGVGGFSIWNLGGWIAVQRMKTLSTRPVDTAVGGAAVRLARRLGLGRSFAVLQSALVGTPMVIGALKPAILLPAGILSDLSAAQLESLLAHELAHIRRHDYVVNLVQCVIETLLYYHPAVWWVSRKIRVEREHCCDDLVVEVTNDRVAYAKALEAIAGAKTSLLLTAATGGPLVDRVRRLLAEPDAARAPRWLPGVIGLVVVILWGATSRLRAMDARDMADQPNFIVIPLGEWASDQPFLRGVNGRGSVIGSSSPLAADSTQAQAFIQTVGNGRRTLAGERGASLDAAVLNENDWIAGSGDDGAFVWSPTDGLIHLNKTLGGRRNAAYGINNRNQVVGYYGGAKGRRAFLWQRDSGFLDLGDLGRGACAALAVNDSGHVVGGAGVGEQGTHAFLWMPERGMRDLGDLPGGDEEASAFAINDRDHVVGYSVTKAGHQGFYWSEQSGLRSIGVLPGSPGGNVARSINNDDWVVGDSADQISGAPRRPFLWTPRHGMRDLNQLLDPAAAGWVIVRASQVNDRGEIFGVAQKDRVPYFVLLRPRDVPARALSTAVSPAKPDEAAINDIGNRLGAIRREADRLAAGGHAAAAAGLRGRVERFSQRLSGNAETISDTPELHLVGLHEGRLASDAQSSGDSRPDAEATVTISAVDRPIVLALCSDQPVTWKLTVAPGSRLEKVLLGGARDQQVIGAPPHVAIERHVGSPGAADRFMTFRKIDPDYANAVGTLRLLTGLEVVTFQGAFRFRGEPFVVGPNNRDWMAQRLLHQSEPLALEVAAFDRATRRGPTQPVLISSERFENLWRALAGDDAATADAAMAELAGGGDAATAFLLNRLFDPAQPRLAAAQLQPAAADRASPPADEAEAILSPELRRQRRVIQALVRIGAPSAVDRLWDLAAESADKRLADWAESALRQIGDR